MTLDNDPDDISMLPADPATDEILDAYQLCRKKLVRANRSRAALKGHDKHRRKLISSLQEQLENLESGLQEETSEKIKIHELNAEVTKIVKVLESGLNETAAIVEEEGDAGLTSWVIRLARLLPILLQLLKVKESANRFFGRKVPSPIQPAPEAEQVLPPSSPETQLPAATSVPESNQQSRVLESGLCHYGPLLLRSLEDYAYGVLLLPPDDLTASDEFIAEQESPWLPGQTLLVPKDPEDPEFAPIEAGFLAIDPGQPPMPALEPWLERGLFPFAPDPTLQLPRLVSLDAIGTASHVLVREDSADSFQEQVGGTPFELDGDHWQGFRITEEEAKDVSRFLNPRTSSTQEVTPRLSNRGGVRMTDGQGYLATGLGLPLLAAPQSFSIEKAQLVLSDDSSLVYERSPVEDPAPSRQLWQPSHQDRCRPDLAEGPARFTACLNDGTVLERSIQLTSLPERVSYRRSSPLTTYREDWGLPLGKLELPQLPPPTTSPSDDAMRWAHQRLDQGDANVNPLFEQQMLDSLSALFQRRASIRRCDFRQLHAQLRNKPDEWPGFPDAVLRGWCEGGWIEEGVERGRARWRIQPVDPRLVWLRGGGVQLVGLLSARGLVSVLANAHQLGLEVQRVLPSCAEMPRGWRFVGAVEAFASASGLPLVNQEDWVPDPTPHAWAVDAPLPCDTPPWPTGQHSQCRADSICGRRGRDNHWKPSQPLPQGGCAPISLQIQAETSQRGKRRWHSHDPVREAVFSSCHRNRVALHALAVASDGLWPFGFTNSEAGQIDRLYDADAYLPLPIGRHAALTGARMPGPTRHRPSDHTYRYYVDRSLRSYLARTRCLPLTPMS